MPLRLLHHQDPRLSVQKQCSSHSSVSCWDRSVWLVLQSVSPWPRQGCPGRGHLGECPSAHFRGSCSLLSTQRAVEALCMSKVNLDSTFSPYRPTFHPKPYVKCNSAAPLSGAVGDKPSKGAVIKRQESSFHSYIHFLLLPEQITTDVRA